MLDYSMNLDERKDFILGYDITKDGQMIIKFAEGKNWIVPYNEVNEKILLDKMKKQLDKVDDIESKLEEKKNKYFPYFVGPLVVGLLSSTFAFSSEMASEILIFSGVISSISLLPLIPYLKVNSKLNDLRKNKKFIEIEEKLNESARTNQNTLVGVCNKTKKAIKDFPEDKPIFNINSFNYVPFSDLEQIMENVERNERFGFDYTEQKQDKGKTRKRSK